MALPPSERKPTKLSTSNKHIAPARKRMRFALVKRYMVRGLHHTLLDAQALRTGIFKRKTFDNRTKTLKFATRGFNQKSQLRVPLDQGCQSCAIAAAINRRLPIVCRRQIQKTNFTEYFYDLLLLKILNAFLKLNENLNVLSTKQ